MIRHAPSEIALSASDIDLAVQRLAAKKRLATQRQRNLAQQIKTARQAAIHQAIETAKKPREARVLGQQTNVRRYVSMPPTLTQPVWSPGDPQKLNITPRSRAHHHQSNSQTLLTATRTRLPESSQENDDFQDVSNSQARDWTAENSHRPTDQSQPVMNESRAEQGRLMRHLTSNTVSSHGLWPS